MVYWGNGNASGDFYDGDRNPGLPPGKDLNLYTASVVALDVATGKLRWYYQEVPGDVYDFDSAYEVILFDGRLKGKSHRLLAHMNKSGLTFILDRATGAVVRAFSVPEVKTWITGVTEDGKLIGRITPAVGKAVTICPSIAGDKSWEFDGILSADIFTRL